jgi:hypothetical protein
MKGEHFSLSKASTFSRYSPLTQLAGSRKTCGRRSQRRCNFRGERLRPCIGRLERSKWRIAPMFLSSTWRVSKGRILRKAASVLMAVRVLHRHLLLTRHHPRPWPYRIPIITASHKYRQTLFHIHCRRSTISDVIASGPCHPMAWAQGTFGAEQIALVLSRQSCLEHICLLWMKWQAYRLGIRGRNTHRGHGEKSSFMNRQIIEDIWLYSQSDSSRSLTNRASGTENAPCVEMLSRGRTADRSCTVPRSDEGRRVN